jgi:uncharacterized protein
MKSALYTGRIRHRRSTPVPHAFEYGVYQVYLDLDEVDRLFRLPFVFARRGPALAAFRRADHFGDPREPLSHSVRRRVREQLGFEPTGPIRLLTQLRHAGLLMNPVSFYFCFDRTERRIEALLAEVTNTPWGEQHVYVWSGDAIRPGRPEALFPKAMHVSPFMDMEMAYRVRVTHPADTLVVHLENWKAGLRIFDATLTLRRKSWSAWRLGALALRYPLIPLKIFAAIYWEAFRLWRKGVPIHPHPRPETTQKETCIE